jgi:ribosome-binding factor A
MKPKNPSRRDLLSSCEALGPGDGVDPRLEPRDTSRKVKNRKALQLCGQVARTLGLALAACGDEVLRDLAVASVVPAPTSARLLVTLYSLTLADTIEAEAVLQRLQRAAGLLRSEVAAAIHRRKAPELLFRVTHPTERG